MDYKSITTEELEQMIRQKGQKDGEALCELGERYLYGKNGTMANPTKAGRLFEKAEKLGENVPMPDWLKCIIKVFSL